MRIKRLDIEGFKVFEKADIHFSENQTTAFIGNNGSGKTSILEGLVLVFPIIINCIKRKGRIPMTGNFDDKYINNNVDGFSNCIYFSLSNTNLNDFYIGYGKSVFEIEDNMIASNCPINYSKNPPVYEILHDIRNSVFSDPTTNIPTIIYYPTDRIVNEIDVEPDELNTHSFAAYDNALDASINFNSFFKWFRNIEDLENEVRLNEDANHRNRNLTAIRTAVETFLPNFSHLRVKRKGQPAMVVKKGKEEMEINQLSHGEKVLLAMVGDIARRLSIANPSLENPLEGEGVVMIDEIELHLHPTWQRMVIDNLEATFPNLQFIVTTHSPQVIGNLQKGSVFSVENGKVYPLPYSYGRDSNWILKIMMDAEERDEEVTEELEQYFSLIEEGKLTDASTLRAKLEEEIGSDYPPFVKADILTRRKQKLLQ
ncbi:MAG: AAA family ATPase [Chitinophagales bacterium]